MVIVHEDQPNPVGRTAHLSYDNMLPAPKFKSELWCRHGKKAVCGRQSMLQAPRLGLLQTSRIYFTRVSQSQVGQSFHLFSSHVGNLSWDGRMSPMFEFQGRLQVLSTETVSIKVK